MKVDEGWMKVDEVWMKVDEGVQFTVSACMQGVWKSFIRVIL